MIQANELRLGNMVKDLTSGNWYRIATISEDDDFEKMDMAPIPLTPEILEKCGFEKRAASRADFVKGSCVVVLVGESQPNTFSLINTGILCTFRYLHQLQNLYFALTSQELEIRSLISSGTTASGTQKN